METAMTIQKKDEDRMDYWHRCECGMEFQGFIHQDTCWGCMKGFLLSFPDLGCRREIE